VNAHATAPLPRTLHQLVQLALADLVLLVCGVCVSVTTVANCGVLGGCTCEKAADGGFNPANEIDFTTKK
jgi:hypothetical protein